MKLSFKYIVKKGQKEQKKIIKDLIWHVTKVSNTLIYDIKEKKIEVNANESLNIISSKIYKEYREKNWHSEYLHSHMLLEAVIGIIGSYKSYRKLNEIYNEDNKKLKGKPNFPRYKKESKQEIIFTKYAIRIEKSKIRLSLSKKMQKEYEVESLNFLIPKKLRKLVDLEQIKMIKIKLKKGNEIEMNIIYETEEKEESKDKNIMAIDLGLNNILACTNKEKCNTLLVSGREAKSKNKYINEKIARLQEIYMKMNKGSKNYKNTKQINRLYEYRNNYMNTFMHKVSKMVIDYAKENKCGKIVIGDIKGIKENMNYNKSFVQVPILQLVGKITYKAKLEGIKVKLISEKYTSGVSALDKEEINKENYNKARRISRGMFITNTGKKINADINGSLNILRKYIKETIPNQEELAMDKGREQRPIKKRVA